MARKKWKTQALTREGAEQGVEVPGSASLILRCGVPFTFEFHWRLDAEHTKDDSVTLEADDGGAPFQQTVVLSKGAEQVRDGLLRVRFAPPPGRSYRLLIDPAKGPDGEQQEPYPLFEQMELPADDAGELAHTAGVDLSNDDDGLDELVDDDDDLDEDEDMLLAAGWWEDEEEDDDAVSGDGAGGGGDA